ncbi:hypothetical protein FD15_GL002174 [Liquorilactobacillus sucicola DSM 21376 = JCM 15457]|uniref:Core domain-containing protein n=1 Tax=Liquorilactobacillus sucicola DSM 21376 = JCM 15457 TaxID=1423806 RepID=A0A0R2DR92_9LACO|nr:iron-sulfur cluster biosynthesis family protein [Liquorilactobacillus sucicola]KRN05611.1 hypothetical protein FD15_GL002174 [Liquorilactobacillus sucicola DSM 21376 = JCM 15457]
MFLTVSSQAQKILRKYTNNQKLRVLLSFDDGVGIYSKLQATCGLETNFDIIIVNDTADLTDYNTSIDTSMGPFLVKGYSLEFLDKDSYLYTDRFSLLILSGKYTGVIDNNVSIKDLSKCRQRTSTHTLLEKTDLI